MSEKYIEELKRVSPEIAKKVSGKIRSKFLLEAEVDKSTTDTGDYKERLSGSIDDYENAVNNVIKNEKKINWGMDIFVVVTTIVLLIVSAVFSNVEGLATTAGVSGVSIVSQVKASADKSKVYNSDATKLRTSVSKLRAALKACSRDDKACLDEVKKKIDEAFAALDGTSET
jgi:hypothetical protein